MRPFHAVATSTWSTVLSEPWLLNGHLSLSIPSNFKEEMECHPLYVGATLRKYTKPPTGHALTIYNFPTTLTIETRQACPGCNQAPNAQLSGGGLPRSDGWTIHMGSVVIKRGAWSNIPGIRRDGVFAAPPPKPLTVRLNLGCRALAGGPKCTSYPSVTGIEIFLGVAHRGVTAVTRSKSNG